MVVEKKADLRYGENPHQLGAFYTDSAHAGGSISSAHQIAGKDLSFNNLLDLDAAWSNRIGLQDAGGDDRQARQPVRAGQRGRPCGGVPAGPRGRQRQRLRRGDRRQPGDRRGRGARHPSGLLRGDRGARATRPRRSRSCARSAASRSSRSRRPRTTLTSSGSASSTSSASAAGSWCRHSTRWRRTATSSSRSPSGAPPWTS